ncbi:MAG: glutamate--tRNA ligase [Pseudomonadota bacterium]
MPERVRFAPSPTGEIHIGNVRTALYNAFLAEGGHFLLRFDDTDAERSKEAFVTQIRADLAWLGVRVDEETRQSARLSAYDAAASDLRARGLLYPCYETPEELERKRALQRAKGRPPVYDRSALSLSDEARAALEAEGRRPHWRFKLPEGSRTFDDLCRGPQTVNLETVSDPILVRADGSYLYTLPSVVDDLAFEITTVVRGEDHVTNSGVQIAIFEALGGTAPRFAHHNLLIRADGEPLSKRDNPLSIRALAEGGYEPMAVAALATLTGTSKPVQPAESLAALGAAVSLSDVSRAPAQFDPRELRQLNAAIVHTLDAPERVDALLWETVRENLTFRADVAAWQARAEAAPEALLSEVAFGADERDVLAAAEGASATDFKEMSAAVKAATGKKGKAAFLPLRKALTGVEAGPNLGPWLTIIGPERAKARLSFAAKA